MKSLLALLVLGAVLPVPALAQPAPVWGGHYNMGSFAAGGGSAQIGHVSLSCAGDSLDDAGAVFLQLEPAAGIEPFVDAPPELDFVIDGAVFTLPVTAEEGRIFFYRTEPGDSAMAAALIDALRRGQTLSVSAPELTIAEIPLRGSFAALTYVAQCVAENG
ncbi:hypothetical protein [Pelagibacterium lacus]|uniref:Invasion associated locus B family protein n=1 Tax=Pelagibacterium lacus TaxID=2282655 RepID=A0A369W4A7_9HYPH|nr:hypothetical protein [Pelagibacterium lacus]RDE08170.1 hypothetical protein DVH29_12995 [Pelagibacterium lacus]